MNNSEGPKSANLTPTQQMALDRIREIVSAYGLSAAAHEIEDPRITVIRNKTRQGNELNPSAKLNPIDRNVRDFAERHYRALVTPVVDAVLQASSEIIGLEERIAGHQWHFNRGVNAAQDTRMRHPRTIVNELREMNSDDESIAHALESWAIVDCAQGRPNVVLDILGELANIAATPISDVVEKHMNLIVEARNLQPADTAANGWELTFDPRQRVMDFDNTMIANQFMWEPQQGTYMSVIPPVSPETHM